MEKISALGIEKISLLYDFYGQLLTEKQRQVMALYHEENLSLSEIGQEFGISRQGVHDTLKKAEQSLLEYEDKLGLVEKLMTSRKAVLDMQDKIHTMVSFLQGVADDAEADEGKRHQAIIRTIKDLKDIKVIIGKLDE